MGYRKIPTIHTLVFDGNLEGLVVRVKSLKMGDMRKLSKIMADEDANTLEELPAFMIRSIVSWNLEDDNGVERPVNQETFDDLELDDVVAIANKWMDTMLGPDEELGKGSPSGAQFPGRPVTMEAL